MHGRDADGFTFTFELEVVDLTGRVFERAGDETAFAFFKGWAGLDDEHFDLAANAHLGHVKIDAAADVSTVVFQPIETAEQLNTDCVSHHGRSRHHG